MSYCLNCTAQVPLPGHTCSEKCYIEWYAAIVRRGLDGMLVLEDNEPWPLPIKQQPWYKREIYNVIHAD